MGDWVKLIVIGGFFETCRRIVTRSYFNLLASFRIDAVFEEGDATYRWIMIWLCKQPSWEHVRSVQVASGHDLNDSHCVVLEVEGLSKFDGRIARKVTYNPLPMKSYGMWYKRRYMTITRVQDSGVWGGKQNVIYISIISRNSGLLKELLQEARREFVASKDNKLQIYASDFNKSWRVIGSRPKRSLQSIVLDDCVKERLLKDAQDFLGSREWYSERGIPFRRGYLLYGAPGSGKTSLIYSLAGELELDVFIVSLSKAGLDDDTLNQLFNELPERCVALMEDIDVAFVQEPNREAEQPAPKKEDQSLTVPLPSVSRRLSLSGLLSCLDGIGAAEGRILFATTNRYSSLDPALTRPGRMDIHIEFQLASRNQAREFFWRFYNPVKSMGDSEDVTEKHPDDVLCSDTSIKILASRFAEMVPERRLSMATLQGFLMNYKTSPLVAVENAPGWLEEELAKDTPISSE